MFTQEMGACDCSNRVYRIETEDIIMHKWVVFFSGIRASYMPVSPMDRHGGG